MLFYVAPVHLTVSNKVIFVSSLPFHAAHPLLFWCCVLKKNTFLIYRCGLARLASSVANLRAFSLDTDSIIPLLQLADAYAFRRSCVHPRDIPSQRERW